ncbi:MAG: hypothetical protein QOH09_1784, partial [Pseudonocardiales bacterium]|nr:hypothetical protein [Pseudonocardiales bacterium]
GQTTAFRSTTQHNRRIRRAWLCIQDAVR